MLVNGIFGVIVEVETLHNFPNESFDDFFYVLWSWLLYTARKQVLCLCVSVAVQQSTVYTYTEEETELLTYSV